MRCSSSNHFPRSTSLQRSLQNGNHFGRCLGTYSDCFPHVGHLKSIGRSLMVRGMSRIGCQSPEDFAAPEDSPFVFDAVVSALESEPELPEPVAEDAGLVERALPL